MDDVDEALADFRAESADLACGSACCPHAGDNSGQTVNGLCRCYPSDHPLWRLVFAAVRLANKVRVLRT